MDEAEWVRCDFPENMLDFLVDTGKANERKLRLFAVACCRHISHWITDERCLRVVDVAEQYADEQTTQEELEDARIDAAMGFSARAARLAAEDNYLAFDGDAVRAAVARNYHYYEIGYPEDATLVAARIPFSIDIVDFAAMAAGVCVETQGGDYSAAYKSESEYQCALLRDIFGNAFCPILPIAAKWLAWNDNTIPKISQTIYDNRRFEDLPILADTLEEAGCTNPEILTHLRCPGPHTRGCWVLDLILGKH